MRKSKWVVGILAVVLFALLGQAAFAAYPEKQITVLQGFKPGGGSDTLAQLTQPYLEKVLGQSFINQYIPGATGAIAWTQLAKTAKKDGYTLSITNTPMLQTNYIMNPEITYTIAELEPIANVITDPGIVVVAKDSPYQTMEEFMNAAKENPGKITVGNSGVGGDDFFTTLIVEKATGLKFQMVPFEGDGPSWQAAMGGKINASFNNLGITYPQIKAGNLRALVIFAEKRVDMLPDVPTMKELGYDVVSGSSRGYSAPKGIPAEARDTLIEAFKKMAEMPEFVKACNDRASIIDMKYGDEYAAMLAEQETAFKAIWNEVKEQYQGK
ncbi:Bug family tripartite tricarboxylate transporter substrate binding protein [Aminiphilus circumscriptus]|jgi:tripartite-type tricarboxylate transporter receptor subunit TctC|uniref:Bug family tripartite tricarboxylate transporter substrate binding protein n=1 Tax=Aminiphilus circumscriptus TaxID=290732 RepID=UPI0004785564|nr:tripartite tricarboxylate transporter substrate binding protein [Aminiphilus circumscriptus]